MTLETAQLIIRLREELLRVSSADAINDDEHEPGKHIKSLCAGASEVLLCLFYEKPEHAGSYLRKVENARYSLIDEV